MEKTKKVSASYLKVSLVLWCLQEKQVPLGWATLSLLLCSFRDGFFCLKFKVAFAFFEL
jgi:hypothetical protein